MAEYRTGSDDLVSRLPADLLLWCWRRSFECFISHLSKMRKRMFVFFIRCFQINREKNKANLKWILISCYMFSLPFKLFLSQILQCIFSWLLLTLCIFRDFILLTTWWNCCWQSTQEFPQLYVIADLQKR